MKLLCAILGLGLVLSLNLPAWATVPNLINYQGKLTDASGTPIATSTTLEFRIYDASTGGTLLWGPETHTVTPASGGAYSVMLGSVVAFPTGLFEGSPRWLGITAGTDPEMTPRQRIVSAGYAHVAKTVEDGAITSSKVADGAITSSKIADGTISDADLGNEPGVDFTVVAETLITGVTGPAASVTLTVPTSGFAVVTATGWFFGTTSGSDCDKEVKYDISTTSGVLGADAQEVLVYSVGCPDPVKIQLARTEVFSVTAGTVSFYFNTGPGSFKNLQLVAIFFSTSY